MPSDDGAGEASRQERRDPDSEGTGKELPGGGPAACELSTAHKAGRSSKTTLEQVLDRYLEELAAGNCPDQQRYLTAVPITYSERLVNAGLTV